MASARVVRPATAMRTRRPTLTMTYNIEGGGHPKLLRGREVDRLRHFASNVLELRREPYVSLLGSTGGSTRLASRRSSSPAIAIPSFWPTSSARIMGSQSPWKLLKFDPEVPILLPNRSVDQ